MQGLSQFSSGPDLNLMPDSLFQMKDQNLKCLWISAGIIHKKAVQHVSHNSWPFFLSNVLCVTVEGLQAAHSGHMPFRRDGCYFLHKEGNYDTDGLTPLALLWKDQSCSQYFIDTDANGVVPRYQNIILRYQEDGTVGTADDPPVNLGNLPSSFTAASNASLRSPPLPPFAGASSSTFSWFLTCLCAHKTLKWHFETFCPARACNILFRDIFKEVLQRLVAEEIVWHRPGRLLRFSIREDGLDFHNGELIGADLHFEGLGNQRRGRADTCSKVSSSPFVSKRSLYVRL